MQLKIELEAFDGKKAYAFYDNFTEQVIIEYLLSSSDIDRYSKAESTTEKQSI